MTFFAAALKMIAYINFIYEIMNYSQRPYIIFIILKVNLRKIMIFPQYFDLICSAQSQHLAKNYKCLKKRQLSKFEKIKKTLLSFCRELMIIPKENVLPEGHIGGLF